MIIWAILKGLKKNYQATKNFIVSWLIKKLVKKNMNNKLIYNKLEMKMIKDYHDLYLKCGVLLLSDVFRHFRNNIFKNYGLCPSHYLSEAALSRHAMLNITKV